jgi:hypothetical protein
MSNQFASAAIDEPSGRQQLQMNNQRYQQLQMSNQFTSAALDEQSECISSFRCAISVHQQLQISNQFASATWDQQ